MAWIGQRRSDAPDRVGGHSRFKEECREAMGGNAIDQAIPGCPLQPAGAAEIAWVFTGGGDHSRARHWRDSRNIFGGEHSFATSVRSVVRKNCSGFIRNATITRAPNFSLPEYCDYRDQTTFFESLAGVASFNPSFADSGPPEHVQGVRMSASAFTMLGVQPFLGRTLIAEDDRNGARGVAVISYGLWSRRYARDPAVIGRAVNVNGETREIVGVLPASFALPNLDTLRSWCPCNRISIRGGTYAIQSTSCAWSDD